MDRSNDDGASSRFVAVDGFGDLRMRCADADDAGDDENEDQEETSIMETSVKSLPTEWTDEKHSSYLKSMEASFVDQLYDSTGFPCFHPQNKESLEPKPHSRTSIRTLSGQFKTLRGGCWQKINVGKGEHPEGLNTSSGLLSNPWIRHYRHSERQHRLEATICQGKALLTDQDIDSRGTAALPYRFTRSLKISNAVPSNLHCPGLSDSETEESGQNFVNEDLSTKEEKPSILCNTKRVKTEHQLMVRPVTTK